ncbi:unnamed protein product [Urochloa humidicola]
MLRPSSSRSHRSKKLRPSHTLQAFLLVAVGVWIAYQLTRSYGRQRVVAVETDGEPERRWLGRKGFVEDIVGAAGSSDDRSSQAGDAGDDEDQEADGDDGVDPDADDVGGGLAADEEEDDTDFQSQGGSDENELKMKTAQAQAQAQNGLNMTIVPQVNATVTVQDGGGAVLPVNATGGVADGAALTSGDSALNNSISADDLSLHDNGSSSGGNQSLLINKNETSHSVAEHVIT